MFCPGTSRKGSKNAVVVAAVVCPTSLYWYAKHATIKHDTYRARNMRRYPPLTCMSSTARPCSSIHRNDRDGNPSSIRGRVDAFVPNSTENVSLLTLMRERFRRASDVNYCFSFDIEPIWPKQSTTCSADQELCGCPGILRIMYRVGFRVTFAYAAAVATDFPTLGRHSLTTRACAVVDGEQFSWTQNIGM